MKSKYHFKDSSLYIKGTDIPQNRYNITDSKIIHELEKELLKEAYTVFYDELNEQTIFDESYFINLHKRTFESLYDWAGKYRDFDMIKGESRFCQGQYVKSYSKKIFKELKDENYLKIYKDDKKNFAKRLAYYKCELIALHPFYELNGRIIRMFMDLIASYNGYSFIDYSHYLTKEYIKASIDCVQFADCSKFEKIIFDGLKYIS